MILEIMGGLKHAFKTKNRIIVVPGANMSITPDDIAFLKQTIKEYDMVINNAYT